MWPTLHLLRACSCSISNSRRMLSARGGSHVGRPRRRRPSCPIARTHLATGGPVDVFDTIEKCRKLELPVLHPGEPECHREDLALVAVAARWVTRWPPIALRRVILAGQRAPKSARRPGQACRKSLTGSGAKQIPYLRRTPGQAHSRGRHFAAPTIVAVLECHTWTLPFSHAPDP
jgi:hypothetical protein